MDIKNNIFPNIVLTEAYESVNYSVQKKVNIMDSLNSSQQEKLLSDFSQSIQDNCSLKMKSNGYYKYQNSEEINFKITDEDEKNYLLSLKINQSNSEKCYLTYSVIDLHPPPWNSDLYEKAYQHFSVGLIKKTGINRNLKDLTFENLLKQVRSDIEIFRLELLKNQMKN